MMLINQLAKETGIPAHTIRFYEKSGLIKGKKKTDVKSNNYTYYDEETAEKLELINEAKSVGFTLSEIRELIDAWYSKKFSIERKLAILDAKLVSVNEKIQQLKQVKKQIALFKEEIKKYDC